MKVNLKNLLGELEFKTPAEFAAYKKKHKMRPGTVVKVAGKDKVVGGDDASKASPKKRFSDIPFTQADVGQIKQFAKDNNLDIKDMSRDPNGAISVDFDGTDEDMEKALTSDAYGDDPQDAKDTVARGTEIGKDSESKPKETTPIENRPGETFGKNYKSVGDMMDSISQQKERVQLNIFDFDSMDQFNGALFIEDGKLMYPGLDGEPTEVDDQDTQMALFDLVKDEQVNVGRSEFRQGDRIKDNGGMHSANILKNMKGNWDFDGVQKIGNDFYNADGELLIVPQKGQITLHTELGILDIAPNEIAVIPRGIKFAVDLKSNAANGYICENYGAPLMLPEKGPIGANGMASPRDFLTPIACFEDVEKPCTLIAKFNGKLFSYFSG